MFLYEFEAGLVLRSHTDSMAQEGIFERCQINYNGIPC